MAEEDASPTPQDGTEAQDSGAETNASAAEDVHAEPAADETADASNEQAAGPDGRNVDLPNFQQVLADVEASGLNLLHDVELNVKIELGRTNMYVEDVLRLAEGSVVELDKLAGDPVDIYVNERLVARGEVLVLNDNFCVRVSEIVGETDADDEADESTSMESGGAEVASGQPAQAAR